MTASTPAMNGNAISTACSTWPTATTTVALIPRNLRTIRKTVPMLADADFGYFDENQDGKITREEFVGKPSEFILSHDRNGDCRVTPEEMKPAENTNAPKTAHARPVALKAHG